jgi:hypothetical protein
VLLRAWLKRLRDSGVEFVPGARLVRLTKEEERWRLQFQGGAERPADAVVLALGGASWPETGSDGQWPSLLRPHGVEIAPFLPANCGWNLSWPAAVLERAEGLPLKNLRVTAGAETVAGELLITRYGLEGGAIYRLGPVLRQMAQPEIAIDFKPPVSAEILLRRSAPSRQPNDWVRAWKLSSGAVALFEGFFPDDKKDAARMIARLKNFPLSLESSRPIAEAISTAGGVRWHELDRRLMLRKMPGVFLAGEMIDWEAPTGGYLLQGCFSTGTRAGESAAAFVT